MKKILINFAHPAYERSRANRALLEKARELPQVTVNDLYEEYPDFLIKVPREQELLAAHEVIVFQHPLYWYSSPSLLKEWLDLVLTHGWAYGSEGRALAGKRWAQAVTTGGPEEVYRPQGLNRFTIAEFLRPFEATAHLCSMDWRAPHVAYGTHQMSAEDITRSSQAYAAFLQNLS